MITPYLALVLAGFAAFILGLGTVWARGYIADLRAARRAQSLPSARQDAPSALRTATAPAFPA
jgi:hypothetical protein